MVGARFGDDQRVEQTSEVPPPAADGHVADASSEVDEPDPIAGAQVVLGDRRRRPHGDVEAAGATVDAVAAAEVGLGVEQQQHVGVAVRPRGRDVQLAGTGRHPPVDAAQAVAGPERADLGRLAATALAVGAVEADEPGRPGHGVTGIELGAQRQRRDDDRSGREALGAERAEPRRARRPGQRDRVPAPPDRPQVDRTSTGPPADATARAPDRGRGRNHRSASRTTATMSPVTPWPSAPSDGAPRRRPDVTVAVRIV